MADQAGIGAYDIKSNKAQDVHDEAKIYAALNSLNELLNAKGKQILLEYDKQHNVNAKAYDPKLVEKAGAREKPGIESRSQ